MRGKLGHQSTRGMTLIELLVSMAIFGMVMTLVAQAVSQVGHVVRVADDGNRQLADRWAGGGAVALAISSLVAPREGGLRPFVGRSDSIEGTTTQPLERAGQGVGPIALELRARQAEAGQTLLNARFAADRSVAGSAWKSVGVFDGRAEFVFRNRKGVWIKQWPQLTSERELKPEMLPSAIMVRDADSGRLLMVYPVSASETVQRPPIQSPIHSDEP